MYILRITMYYKYKYKPIVNRQVHMTIILEKEITSKGGHTDLKTKKNCSQVGLILIN